MTFQEYGPYDGGRAKRVVLKRSGEITVTDQSQHERGGSVTFQYPFMKDIFDAIRSSRLSQIATGIEHIAGDDRTGGTWPKFELAIEGLRGARDLPTHTLTVDGFSRTDFWTDDLASARFTKIVESLAHVAHYAQVPLREATTAGQGEERAVTSGGVIRALNSEGAERLADREREAVEEPGRPEE
jgi:hypothetical protein